MKGFFFALFLLLSLPNLIVGLALLVLCHTFATLHPLEIVTNFLFQITWSVPLAAGLFLLLVVIGIISITRPYASVFALVLNAVALGLALFRLGLPHDVEKLVIFVPVVVALIGFGWLAYPVCRPRGSA